jgi:hypothetical protein
MGAGRKTSTYDVDTRNESNYRFEQQQKNLGTQLGGVIFSKQLAAERLQHKGLQLRLVGQPGSFILPASHLACPALPDHVIDH